MRTESDRSWSFLPFLILALNERAKVLTKTPYRLSVCGLRKTFWQERGCAGSRPRMPMAEKSSAFSGQMERVRRRLFHGSWFLSPSSGKLLLNESDATSSPAYKRARQGLVYLPQERPYSVNSPSSRMLSIRDFADFQKRAGRACGQQIE